MDEAGPKVSPRRAWSPYVGVALTFGMLLLTEELHHGLEQEQLSVTTFLLALAPIAFTALVGGLFWGLVAAAPVALYTLHYAGPHGAILTTTPEAWQGALIMAVLGVGMAYPMSLIKRREDRLRGALTAHNRELSRRNKELMESNATLEAFGYVVSHDLKEPVRALENYLEAALEEYPSEESKGYVQEAYRANQRLSKMLQGLLEYSRTSSSVTTMAAQRIDAVIRSETCRTQYERLLRERGGSLDVSPDIPAVLGDEVVLAQLFGNVILNAIRHNAQTTPQITVRSAEATAGRVHVVVADNGPGFPPEVLARFAKVHVSRPATVKGGFGLVITKRAAERLGGRVWLANRPTGGAEVHLELPAPPPESALRSSGRADARPRGPASRA